jgi:type I restriction-modification system DNA methylase subunit
MVATVKSRQRIIDHGEVFTPPGLVNDMLDLVAHECERIDSRFLEPACGDGNFLAEVLRRKLLTVDKKNASNRDKWERDAILAVCSLYGIDLLHSRLQNASA